MLAIAISLLFASAACASLWVIHCCVARGLRLNRHFREQLLAMDNARPGDAPRHPPLRPARAGVAPGFSPALLNSAGWTHRTARRSASVHRAAA